MKTVLYFGAEDIVAEMQPECKRGGMKTQFAREVLCPTPISGETVFDR